LGVKREASGSGVRAPGFPTKGIGIAVLSKINFLIIERFCHSPWNLNYHGATPSISFWEILVNILWSWMVEPDIVHQRLKRI
jgi:hypothetical protein